MKNKYLFVLIISILILFGSVLSVSAFTQDDVTLVQNTEHCKDDCVLEFDVVQTDGDKSMGFSSEKIDYKVIDLASKAKSTSSVQWLKHAWTTSTPVYGLVEHTFVCNGTLSDAKVKNAFVECYAYNYFAGNLTPTKTVLWSGTAKEVKDKTIIYDVNEVVSSTVESHEEWLGQTDKLQNLKIYVDGQLFNANFDSKYTSTVWKSGEKHRVKVTGSLKNYNDAIDIIPSMFGIYVTKLAPWNSSWGNCRAINFTNPVLEAETNYPILLAFNASGYGAQADGDDYVFINDADCTNTTGGTALSYEVDTYDSTGANNSYFWIKANLTSGGIKQLAMLYNNPTIGAQSNPTDVWDNNYVYVFHLNDNNNTLLDSRQLLNGDKGTGTGITKVGGVIGYAQNSTGSANSCLNVSGTVRKNPYTAAGSLEMWFVSAKGWNSGVATTEALAEDNSILNWHIASSATPRFQIYCGGGGWTPYTEGVYNVPANVWTFYAWRWNAAGTSYSYYNNTLDSQLTKCIDTGAYGSTYLGRPYDCSSPMSGKADEIRLSNSTRSVGWINLTYLMTSSPSSYWSLGGEQGSNTAPSVSTPSWVTTGSFSSGTRVYGQEIDNVTVVCGDVDGSPACNLTVTDPNGVVVVNNVAMTNVSGNATSITALYDVDFTLNVAGSWVVNVTAYDASTSASNSTTIVVATSNRTTVEGHYGFTTNGIPSENDIGTNVGSYKFGLVEITDNITSFSADFTDIKARINTSYYSDVVSAVNLILDCNCSNQSDVLVYVNQINTNYPVLLTTTYRSDLVYLSLQFLNDSYTTAEADDCFNNISKAVVNATSNQFVVYAKGYNSSGLDSSYIEYTPMLYNSETTQGALINWEAAVSRNSSSLNRIYDVSVMNSTLLTIARGLQDDAYKILRSTINESTTVVNLTVAELDNYDILVFNNESSAWVNKSITFKSGSGKDVYDKTNKKIIENNTDLTILVNVAAYGVTYHQLDDFDHFQLTSNSLGTLYKATLSGAENFTWTDDGRDAANQVTGSTRRRFYLYDSKFEPADTCIEYGWLNASLRQNWTDCEILIIADKNDGEVDKVVAQAVGVYGYISLGSYNESNATWVNDTKAAIDAWLALNASMNILFNSLDRATITNATDFDNKLIELKDYVRVTKSRKLGLNTYTYNELYCTYGDWCMFESSVQGWNGTNASAPDAFVRHLNGWDLALNKSSYYQSHNVEVVAVNFGNKTSDTFCQVYNQSEMVDVYYASMVLGFEHFYFGFPDFQCGSDVYVPDVGTDLANSWSTDDNVTYYRAFSNGIVYYNTSSGHGWQDDGRTFTSVILYANLHDDAAVQTYDFLISDGLGTQYNYSYSTAGAGWAYNTYAITLNTTNQNSNGRYLIEVAGETGIAYVGMDTSGATLQGYRSWVSLDSGATWTLEPLNNFYLLNLEVNDARKASLDSSISGVTQTNASSGRTTTINLTSSSDFPIEVWSIPLTFVADSYYNMTWWNGSTYKMIYPQESSDCASDNPTFNSTTVDGVVVKACKYTTGTSHVVRYAAPSLSDRGVALFMNNVPSFTQNLDTIYTSSDANCSGVYSDADGDAGTAWVQYYLNGTANLTSNMTGLATGTFFNFTLDDSYFVEGDNVTCELWAGDGLENASKSNVSGVVQPSTPVIGSMVPADGTDFEETTTVTLSWNVTSDSTIGNCSLYAGTTNPPSFVGNVSCTSGSNTTYNLTVTTGTTNYWFLSVNNTNGTTTSSTYYFRVGSSAVVAANAGGGAGGGSVKVTSLVPEKTSFGINDSGVAYFTFLAYDQYGKEIMPTNASSIFMSSEKVVLGTSPGSFVIPNKVMFVYNITRDALNGGYYIKATASGGGGEVNSTATVVISQIKGGEKTIQILDLNDGKDDGIGLGTIGIGIAMIALLIAGYARMVRMPKKPKNPPIIKSQTQNNINR